MKTKVSATGSRFDDFLEEEGLLAEAEAVAIKRVLAWQVAEAMKTRKLTKDAMAKKMKTSRSQLDRLLDPEAASVTLATMTRAAAAVGKKLSLKLVNS
jgi:antitoxin HicB